MAKLLISYRAVFTSGAQRKFLEHLGNTSNIRTMAQHCACSERTIRDWRREKFAISITCLKILCKAARIPLPKHRVRNQYAHMKAAAMKGWNSVLKKYGRVPRNEEKRKHHWEVWWQTKGRFVLPPQFTAKKIRRPAKSERLAEFVGIMMGDGSLSKYQAVITLHHTDDLLYSKFVVQLIKKLFHVTPKIYHSAKDSVNDIVISRTLLVHYLNTLGLPMGNKIKQQFDIPPWIIKKRKFRVACMRGLLDTDGSVLLHRYSVNGKKYEYKKLSFTSRSARLLISVKDILTTLGMKARISGYDVRLESKADVKKYFDVIGSHNPKHLKRYRSSSTMRQ